MEILVVDIETSGLHTKFSSIVEIGLVLVNTKTKTIKTLFDKVIRESNFKPNYKPTPWIFVNSDLTINDVLNAQLLDSYKDELQGYFDKYPLTAFNKKFDLRFLRDRGFEIKEIKCLMESTKSYFTVRDKRGSIKGPSVMEAYGILFPGEKYIEKHRGGDDAKHEAKILLELVRLNEKQKLLTEN